MAVKFDNSKQLRKEIASGKRERIYLFLGEEEGDKDKVIDEISIALVPNDDDRKNSMSRFHSESGEFMQAAEHCMSRSMFGSLRMCVIKNIDQISASKNDISVFREMLANLDDNLTLIMTSSEIKPPSFIGEDEMKGIRTIQFWRYFDSDIANYISASAKKAGMRLDDSAFRLLVSYTGKDIRKIDQALDLLGLSGESGVLTAEIVKKYLYDQSDATIFEFIDLFFKRDGRSLLVLKKILEQGTPELAALNLIAKQAESLERFHWLVSEGEDRDSALKSCGIFQKNAESFLLHSRIFTLDLLKRVFPLISKTDNSLKSGSRSGSISSNPLFIFATEVLMMKFV